MDKIERVRATLAGKPADRAPFTVWYHFGNQHAPAERAAAGRTSSSSRPTTSTC